MFDQRFTLFWLSSHTRMFYQGFIYVLSMFDLCFICGSRVRCAPLIRVLDHLRIVAPLKSTSPITLPVLSNIRALTLVQSMRQPFLVDECWRWVWLVWFGVELCTQRRDAGGNGFAKPID
jgi:hypothetical protein